MTSENKGREAEVIDPDKSIFKSEIERVTEISKQVASGNMTREKANEELASIKTQVTATGQAMERSHEIPKKGTLAEHQALFNSVYDDVVAQVSRKLKP